jgi:hypothetical protein
MGWDLQKDLIARPNPQRAQEAIQSHPSMAKAVREADANLPGKGSLVLGDSWPLNQVACIS